MDAEKKGKGVAKVMKRIGMILLITIVAIVALLFGAVKFLESKELSPMAERLANEYIDGHLKIGSLRLGFNPRFPFLGVTIKDLTIISHAFDSLSPAERGIMPEYADSLLTLDRLSGTLDVKRLVVNNELSLRNVELSGLGVNIVIAHNGKANYEVLKLPEEDDSQRKMPGFRINRFALQEPRVIRFYNAADSTSASVLLLTDAAVDGGRQPEYRLKINGNVTSPKATLITNLEDIRFGINGKINWNPELPGLLTMERIEVDGAFIKCFITGEVDFTDRPIVRKAEVELAPVAVSDLLTLLPDSVRKLHGLYEPYFSTDAVIEGSFSLLKPMDLTTDTVPSSILKISVPPASLHYGKSELKDLQLNVVVSTTTNQPDSTRIDISRLVLESPSALFEAAARISTPVSDPSFEAQMQGDIDLGNLPPILKEKIEGYLAGIVTTDLTASGKLSMFSQEHLHRLVADGSVMAKDVYFLSADTTKMVMLGKGKVNFETRRETGVASSLKATVEIDTANILSGGVDVAIGSLKLGAAARESGKRDTTHFVPVDADLMVKRLNIMTVTDSAGGWLRNIAGNITLNRPKSKAPFPDIVAKITTGHSSAGTLSDRIVLDNAIVNATLSKLPTLATVKDRKEKKPARIREYSYLAPEAVFKYVYKKRHHKHRIKRVYGTLNSDNTEVLEWVLTPQFSRFLTEWELRGDVNTKSARLLTLLFPVSNRITNVNVRFSNDTVGIRDITMRLGKSDITLSGQVSNVRRALTSKSDNTLKANLSLLSDTIDINEISDGVFRGADYAERRRRGKVHISGSVDDKTLQAKIDAFSKEKPGKIAPVLIPVNIDANLRIGADNVLYSDLILQNMGGDILVYDGGVNLHNINAGSEAGNLSLSALYSAPRPEDMQFGLGMELKDFNVGKFVDLVPAVDSIVPLIHDFSGMVSADVAVTCRIDSGMNLMLPTLNAAIKIDGDNLSFIDPEKYRTLGKWLGFKNKADNTIHRMNVEMTVADGLMRVYPFAFNIDRYRLGIYGYNDLAMNFDYHLSVLKSPLPFKFGITISGNPKKYKVRFGGAKFKENTAIESVSVVNQARINLIEQIENVFKRGVQKSRFAKLEIARPADYDMGIDQGLTPADSLRLIQEGILPAPNPTDFSEDAGRHSDTDKHHHKKKNKERKDKKVN